MVAVLVAAPVDLNEKFHVRQPPLVEGRPVLFGPDFEISNSHPTHEFPAGQVDGHQVDLEGH